MDLSEQSERMQSFYGLKYDPFGALVDAMVFSGAGGRYEVAETIRHLLTYSPQDGLVIGPTGSGKRTLVQHVLKMLEDHWRIAWVDGSEIASSDDLLKEVVGQLGLGLKVDPNPEAMVAHINQITAERSHAGEAFLLVIQYADQLPEDLLSLAARFRTPNQLDSRLRQLWLVESEDAISRLHEDDWFSYPLSALTDDDAALYLKDRLVAAGNVGELPFAAKDVGRLNQMSKGSLLALNELARDYLIGSTFRTAEKSKGFPLTHVIAGIAALTIVCIALLYNLNEKKSAVVSVEPTQTENIVSEVQQRLAEAAAKVEAKAVASNAEVQPAPSAEPEPTIVEAEQSDVEPSETLVQSDLDVSSPVEALEPLPEVDSVDATPAPAPTNNSLLARASDSDFTMQLIGVRDRSKLDSVMQEFSDPSLIDVVQTTYDNKPWFVLIYGQFTSKADAQKAISSLPAQFEKETPWIRNFAAIRKTALN